MKTIVTTVGTSIITNYLSPEGKRQVGNKYVPIDAQWKGLSIDKNTDLEAVEIHNPRYRNSVEGIRKVLKHRWFAKADGTPNVLASAEISSILKIAGGRPCSVHLLATDTLQSVLAATLIRDWFEQFKDQYKIEVLFQLPSTEFNKQDDNDFVVKDLKVSAQSDYNKGVLNLFFCLNKIKELYQEENVLLNITAGYKAIIPLVSLWAQISRIPVYYLYNENVLEPIDNGKDIIEISPMPLNFDYWIFTENYLAFLLVKPDRKKLPSKEDFCKKLARKEDYELLKKFFIIHEDNEQVKLTSLGELLYKTFEKNWEEDQGFDVSHMVGKVMEYKVGEWFSKMGFENVKYGVIVGSQNYDLDVVAIRNFECFVVEVKPEGAPIFAEGMNKPQKSLEYKCYTGGFKTALEKYENEKHEVNICFVSYSVDKPREFIKESVIKLKSQSDNPVKEYFRWFWVKPPNNFRGNVNWEIDGKKATAFEFDFEVKRWKKIEKL